MIRHLSITLFLLSASLNAATPAANVTTKTDGWFHSSAGRRTVECILSWQAAQGDWPKNTDTSTKEYSGDRSKLKGTFDNGATTSELRILARAIRSTNDARYTKAFLAGFDLILKAQYPNGGWPQYFPLSKQYHRHITFNDGARFYEIKSNRPFFCDRDGVVKYDVEEIGGERRKGYSWYSNAGEKVAKAYAKWTHR